ncbi:hypothetical protein GGS21DRAFT_487301 [Xylaria nigripes]|nr:hypothetical protein GGS21DRAFT_487301 [Xylaria nigripes]
MGNTLAHQYVSDEVKKEGLVDDNQVATKAQEQQLEGFSSEINDYLLKRVPTFRRLVDLRDKGWKNPAGDAHFAKQRNHADSNNNEKDKFFFRLMITIGQEIHDCTGVFQIKPSASGPPKILDMCMAPGAFLQVAMQQNPQAHARAFTLPVENGGHRVLMQPNPNIIIKPLDVTMLAADMGVNVIPPTHPDANNFLPQELYPDDLFDLAICDGQVLRTHTRASYRESQESARLALTQLTIALEHIRPGGTILILTHKIESWRSVMILHMLSKFSVLKVHKPKSGHVTRSSCYIVAFDVRPNHEDAVRAVRAFKQLWKAATFDTEEEFWRLSRSLAPNVRDVLEEFGPELVRLARPTWETQANALAKAPWNQRSQASSWGRSLAGYIIDYLTEFGVKYKANGNNPHCIKLSG